MTRPSLRYAELRTVAATRGIDPDVPVAGFYRMRLRSGAVFVGVRIWFGAPLDPVTGEELDRAPTWCAQINGAWADIADVWPRCAGGAIDEIEHDYLAATHQWGVRYAPHSPQANPTRRVNLLSAPLPF